MQSILGHGDLDRQNTSGSVRMDREVLHAGSMCRKTFSKNNSLLRLNVRTAMIKVGITRLAMQIRAKPTTLLDNAKKCNGWIVGALSHFNFSTWVKKRLRVPNFRKQKSAKRH